jgi:ABC-type polysaccharide/polyol phosphate export permease
MLTKKDLSAVYRRAVLGRLWNVAIPVVQAIVLAVVFSRVVRIETGTHFATFVYAGILPWAYFNATLAAAVVSVTEGRDLATMIYFPRAVLPLVSVGSNIYSFLPGLVLLVLMGIVFDVALGANVLLLVPATVLLITLAGAFSLVLAAAQVYFRDVRYLLTAASLVWFYATPIFYPLKLAPSGLRRLVEINPMTGVVELFRAGTVGADPGWHASLAWSLGWSFFLLAAAALLYRRYDRVLVDRL